MKLKNKLKNKLNNKLNNKLVSLLLIIMVTLTAIFIASCAEKKTTAGGTTGGGSSITDGNGEGVERTAACQEGFELQLVNNPAGGTDSTTLFEFAAGTLANKANTDANVKIAYLKIVPKNSGCKEVYRLLNTKTFNATGGLGEHISQSSDTPTVPEVTESLNTTSTSKGGNLVVDDNASSNDVRVTCKAPVGTGNEDMLQCTYEGETLHNNGTDLSGIPAALQPAEVTFYVLTYANIAARETAVEELTANLVTAHGQNAQLTVDALTAFAATAEEVKFTATANVTQCSGSGETVKPDGTCS